uniref:Uncharacterized protein n=1 Tax=Electrophorus electricus TaxID=8005 RepID=A0A4W4EVN1_ELEEL
MRSSIDWPASSRFSISTSSLTPSTTICTSSTSEKPNRSAFEMSKVPPTAAVSTPPGLRHYGYQRHTRERGFILDGEVTSLPSPLKATIGSVTSGTSLGTGFQLC